VDHNEQDSSRWLSHAPRTHDQAIEDIHATLETHYRNVLGIDVIRVAGGMQAKGPRPGRRASG
jgi:hypothetical protein